SLTAVNKLNLKVKTNTIHGFLGPNGAGKTTTIKLFVGLLKPDEGTISIFGQEVVGDRPDVRLRMGYMPELPKFPKHLTGYELLDIYGKMYGLNVQERREQVPRLLEMVGLEGRGNDRIGKYSKGMQQRIGIAQALINNPELVIMDEPSLGLDPVGMVEVREIMKAIVKRGMTVFISSHLLHEVQQVCSHITIINRGITLASDTLENLSNQLLGPSTLEVEVTKLTDVIVKNVKKVPFVSSISKEDNKLVIQVEKQEDVRPQVSEAVTKSGGVIVTMNLKERNLEDVFMKLIIKSKGAKTK
ncbi:ABC transporter ATP-binding protein, partial [Candidatus Bathyarchaeota archaeon]|nr:ABC transporter ATP-binding protein [Candidatus Bathyarchaeota archaeon]